MIAHAQARDEAVQAYLAMQGGKTARPRGHDPTRGRKNRETATKNFSGVHSVDECTDLIFMEEKIELSNKEHTHSQYHYSFFVS